MSLNVCCHKSTKKWKYFGRKTRSTTLILSFQ